MRALAILNPAAGNGRGLRVWPALRARFLAAGWTLAEATAAHSGHERDLAADAARQGFETVLVVGGDGTAHWVANGLLHAGSEGPTLAVVPVGTGNDFAAALGLPRKAEAAVGALLSARTRRVDVGEVAGRYFLTIGTVGFASEVARQVNAWPKLVSGTVMYVAGILKMLVVFGPVEMDVTLDGQTRRQRLFMLAAGNTHSTAGGMKLCPEARPDDGLLEAVLIGDVSKAEVLTILPKVFSGRHVLHPKIDVVTAGVVAVASNAPLSVQADGELLGTLPATFTVRRAALPVLAP